MTYTVSSGTLNSTIPYHNRMSLRFNGHFSRWTWAGFIEAKDDRSDVDNWSYKSCERPWELWNLSIVKISTRIVDLVTVQTSCHSCCKAGKRTAQTGFIEAKDDKSDVDNWSYKSCKRPWWCSELLQSNHHHQQTNIQFLTDRMPFLSPNQQY